MLQVVRVKIWLKNYFKIWNLMFIGIHCPLDDRTLKIRKLRKFDRVKVIFFDNSKQKLSSHYVLMIERALSHFGWNEKIKWSPPVSSSRECHIIYIFLAVCNLMLNLWKTEIEFKRLPLSRKDCLIFRI